MNRILIRICLAVVVCSVLAVCSTSFAKVVPHLFSATVPVADYSLKVREQATSAALQQVLVKVSGNNQINTVPSLREALRNASKLVQGFNYLPSSSSGSGSNPSSASASASGSNSSSTSPDMQLNISFNQSAVKQLLKTTGQPLWGAQRPAILVWVLVSANPGEQAKLIEDDNNDETLAQFKNAFAARGIPLTQPVVDLQLLQALAASQPGPMITSQLLAAAERYDNDGVLIVHLQQHSDLNWQGEFSLRMHEQAMQWDFSNSQMPNVIQSGVARLADELANRYAQLQSAQQQHDAIQLAVSGIEGQEQYAKVVNYLQALSAVEDVQVLDLDGDTLAFNITLLTSPQTFIEQIALDKFLQPEKQLGYSAGDDNARDDNTDDNNTGNTNAENNNSNNNNPQQLRYRINT